jgi:hypothetical protein
MTPLKLDEQGRCPHCLVKPLVYKRNHQKFCHRCDRAFDIHTGEQVDNWAWRKVSDEFIPRIRKRA